MDLALVYICFRKRRTAAGDGFVLGSNGVRGSCGSLAVDILWSGVDACGSTDSCIRHWCGHGRCCWRLALPVVALLWSGDRSLRFDWRYSSIGCGGGWLPVVHGAMTGFRSAIARRWLCLVLAIVLLLLLVMPVAVAIGLVDRSQV
jgi:hypothetical protein